MLIQFISLAFYFSSLAEYPVSIQTLFLLLFK